MSVLSEQLKNGITYIPSQKDVSLNTTICYDMSGNLHGCKYECYE